MKYTQELQSIISEENFEILNEMASSLFQTNTFFLNYSKKVAQSIAKKVEIWETKGWDSTRKYLKIKQTEYLSTSNYKTFSEWFSFEIPLYSKEWDKLPVETRNVMIEFFKKLDKDPSILDKKEK